MSLYRIKLGPKSKESETHRHSDEGHMRVKAEIGVTPPTLPQGAPGWPEAGRGVEPILPWRVCVGGSGPDDTLVLDFQLLEL